MYFFYELLFTNCFFFIVLLILWTLTKKILFNIVFDRHRWFQ